MAVRLIPAEHAHRYVMQSAWIMHAVHCGMQPLSKVAGAWVTPYAWLLHAGD